jgi:short-subunit dehydrogenase
MKMNERSILLTGATGGIGRAVAKRLNAAGARLVLVARDGERLQRLGAELAGDKVTMVPTDLTTAEGRGRVIGASQAARVDVLVNCAGVNEFELLESQSDDAIRRLLDINLLSPMLLCRDLLPVLDDHENAQIVNIGSTFGNIGYPGFGAYCASKFGLRGFTEALRRELDGTGISVACVAPRATRTDLNSDAVIEMNNALGTAMDDPALVAEAVFTAIQKSASKDIYLGWPEKLFVRVNALFPRLVDSSLRKQLPVIRRFATHKP